MRPAVGAAKWVPMTRTVCHVAGDDRFKVRCDGISGVLVSGFHPFIRLAISLVQGDEWNTLISRYIKVIPLMGDEPPIAMQTAAGCALKRAVHNPMSANVGAAAKPSHPTTRGAALPPLPAPPPIEASRAI